MDKTRATPFHPQSNAVIETMNKTLQNMLTKCTHEEQSNWSQQLPYVMMAYRSSVYESTGYTHQFLVFVQKLSLLLDCMYPNYPNPHKMKPLILMNSYTINIKHSNELSS